MATCLKCGKELPEESKLPICDYCFGNMQDGVMKGVAIVLGVLGSLATVFVNKGNISNFFKNKSDKL